MVAQYTARHGECNGAVQNEERTRSGSQEMDLDLEQRSASNSQPGHHTVRFRDQPELGIR